jgi:hypothetical protein
MTDHEATAKRLLPCEFIDTDYPCGPTSLETCCSCERRPAVAAALAELAEDRDTVEFVRGLELATRLVQQNCRNAVSGYNHCCDRCDPQVGAIEAEIAELRAKLEKETKAEIAKAGKGVNE